MQSQNLAIVFAPNLLKMKNETYQTVAKDTPVCIGLIKFLVDERIKILQAAGSIPDKQPLLPGTRLPISVATGAALSPIANEIKTPPPLATPATPHAGAARGGSATTSGSYPATTLSSNGTRSTSPPASPQPGAKRVTSFPISPMASLPPASDTSRGSAVASTSSSRGRDSDNFANRPPLERALSPDRGDREVAAPDLVVAPTSEPTPPVTQSVKRGSSDAANGTPTNSGSKRGSGNPKPALPSQSGKEATIRRGSIVGGGPAAAAAGAAASPMTPRRSSSVKEMTTWEWEDREKAEVEKKKKAEEDEKRRKQKEEDGETRSVSSGSVVNDAASDKARRSTSAAVALGPLDDCWREFSDAKTGRKYYYNNITHQTTWRHPNKDKLPRRKSINRKSVAIGGGPSTPTSTTPSSTTTTPPTPAVTVATASATEPTKEPVAVTATSPSKEPVKDSGVAVAATGAPVSVAASGLASPSVRKTPPALPKTTSTPAATAAANVDGNQTLSKVQAAALASIMSSVMAEVPHTSAPTSSTSPAATTVTPSVTTPKTEPVKDTRPTSSSTATNEPPPTTRLPSATVSSITSPRATSTSINGSSASVPPVPPSPSQRYSSNTIKSPSAAPVIPPYRASISVASPRTGTNGSPGIFAGRTISPPVVTVSPPVPTPPVATTTPPVTASTTPPPAAAKRGVSPAPPPAAAAIPPTVTPTPVPIVAATATSTVPPVAATTTTTAATTVPVTKPVETVTPTPAAAASATETPSEASTASDLGLGAAPPVAPSSLPPMADDDAESGSDSDTDDDKTPAPQPSAAEVAASTETKSKRDADSDDDEEEEDGDWEEIVDVIRDGASELKEGWRVQQIDGRWSKTSSRNTEVGTCGGCYPNFTTWRHNPQYRFTLASGAKDNIIVELKAHPHTIQGDPAIGLYCFKNDGPSQPKICVAKGELLAQSKFVKAIPPVASPVTLQPFNPTGNVISGGGVARLELGIQPFAPLLSSALALQASQRPSSYESYSQSGRLPSAAATRFPPHYTIIPATFEPGVAADYTISIHSQEKLFIKRVHPGERWRDTTIHGEWKGASAGGCRNHSTWEQNPQVLMMLHVFSIICMLL
jgi:hypothetical protein